MKDRFGKPPEKVLALIDSVRLKWAAKELGLEKVSLLSTKFRCYFPSDSSAAIYQSAAFVTLMGFVAANPDKYMAKQTEKAFIIEVKGVTDVFQALYVLNEWHDAIHPHKNYAENL